MEAGAGGGSQGLVVGKEAIRSAARLEVPGLLPRERSAHPRCPEAVNPLASGLFKQKQCALGMLRDISVTLEPVIWGRWRAQEEGEVTPKASCPPPPLEDPHDSEA